MASETNVRIRGTSEGLTITMGEGPWDALLQELDAHLGRRPSFFRGGRVAVAVGERRLSPEAIHALGEVLTRYDMTLWAIWSFSDVTQQAAASLGLETGLGPDQRSRVEEEEDWELQQATIIVGPIRSGQRIHQVGSAVILGDVHPGAEVIATGHVIVWGQLLGIVHAGAKGREEALVCALKFMPTQVRIGKHMARGDSQSVPVEPEIARVVDGHIVVEPWTEWRRWVTLEE
ncbi:MAG: septum site-determining protein MinC [Chloroflexi bacterium]|nr:septum site-determining protein MinC [Chloroflexota bacterium]